MKKLILWLAVIAFIGLTSCGTSYHCKRCPVTTQTVTEYRDTIIKETTISYVPRDTIIEVTVDADSLFASFKITCDSLNRAQLNPLEIHARKLSSELEIVDGILKLRIRLQQDTIQKLITFYEKQITQLEKQISSQNTTTQITLPPEKEKTPGKFYRRFFWWLMSVLVVLGVWATRRVWVPLLTRRI